MLIKFLTSSRIILVNGAINYLSVLSFIVISFLPDNITAQPQLGPDMPGTEPYQRLGWANDISEYGDFIVCGYPAGLDAQGEVQVFKFINNEWQEYGSVLSGSQANDEFGISVAMSDDGQTIAVGAIGDIGETEGYVKVFHFQNGDWELKGQPFIASVDEAWLGYRVELSGDGNIVAMSSPYGNGSDLYSGLVKVAQYDGTDWIPKGSAILGNEPLSGIGSSLSMSENGERIAIGVLNGIQPTFTGAVFVVDFIDGDWVQVGPTLVGNNFQDYYGISVDLNSDGSRMIVGSNEADINGTNSGLVTVYKNVNDSWFELGSPIAGDISDARFGWSVSISGLGNTIGVGRIPVGTSTPDSGEYSIYELTSNEWTLQFEPLTGEFENDLFGYNGSISKSGNRLVVGAIQRSTTEYHAGLVRVYKLNDDVNILEHEANNIQFFPNPAKDFIQFAHSPKIHGRLEILDMLGNIIMHFDISNQGEGPIYRIPISGLASGTYILRIENYSGKIVVL
jgi:Secretion system C-terminal sorting domain/FG-GAP repeat